MTRVKFTTVTEVEMDEFNPLDIAEMGKSIGEAGKRDIESITLGSKVVSVKAMPILEEIDCLKNDEEVLQA